MKIHRIILLVTLFTVFYLSLIADTAPQTNLLLMPIINNGMEDSDISTTYQLLSNELQQETQINLREPSIETINETGNYSTLECGIAAGEQENCDETLTVTMSKLGTKIIIQYILVDVANRSITLVDNIAAESIENLDMVMKRIALSVSEKKQLSSTAEVGSIIDNEDKSYRRRKAARFTGINFGYLYPTKEYDNSERSFTIDFMTMFEMGNIDIGFKLAARKGFAATIFSNYLFSKTDICPYLGGGFGYHNILHKRYYDDDDYLKKKKGDGFEFIAAAGVRFFRTYNFEVMVNLDYIYTMNDFDDQALVFTIGLAKQK